MVNKLRGGLKFAATVQVAPGAFCDRARGLEAMLSYSGEENIAILYPGGTASPRDLASSRES